MHTGTVDIILDKTSCSCFFYYSSPEVLITSGNDKPLFGPPGFFNAVGRISCISIFLLSLYKYYVPCWQKMDLMNIFIIHSCHVKLYIFRPFLCKICAHFSFILYYNIYTCLPFYSNKSFSIMKLKKKTVKEITFFCSLFQYMYAFPGNP